MGQITALLKMPGYNACALPLLLPIFENALSESPDVPLLEQKIIRLDGTVVETEAISAILTYNGKLHIMTVSRDITDRKRAEQLGKKAEENNTLQKENYNQKSHIKRINIEFSDIYS